MRRLAVLPLLLALGCTPNVGPTDVDKKEGERPPPATRRWWRPAARTAQAPPKAGPARRMTQAEVRAAAEGKTPREVLAALGRPDDSARTPDDLDAPDYEGKWYYFHLVADPASGKDRPVYVHFKDGKVSLVEF